MATPVRTLLVSDLHLGCKHAQSVACLRFLQGFAPDTVYLVGDIIDGWKCNRDWHWTEECDDICELIETWLSRGVKVCYAPGNHDAFLRQPNYQRYLPAALNGIRIDDEFIYETLRGWRFLVTHGDHFDVVESKAQWLSKGTSWAYDTVLSLNRVLSRRFRRAEANPYAACAVIKDRVKRAIRFVSKFEHAIFDHAVSRECEGVICGHIHTPAIARSGARLYCNTGDWVENCTGLVEHHDGTMRLESIYGSPRFLKLETHPRMQRTMSVPGNAPVQVSA